MPGFRIFFSVFATLFLLAGTAAAQAPPVFQDAVDDGSQPVTTPPALPPQATQEDTADAGEAAPDDPCAAYMNDYNGYVYCKDMYQKIDRMKKGTAARQESYKPKPPPEDKTKTAEAPKDGAKPEEPKPDDKKAEEGKDDKDKKDGDKKDAEKSGEKKPESGTDKNPAAGAEPKDGNGGNTDEEPAQE